MFHYTPRYASFDRELSPYIFDSPVTTCDPSFAYDAYDARRSRLEQIALAQRQQERRAAEEAAWIQQRRRRAAIQAAIEKQEAEDLERRRQEQLYRQLRARELAIARAAEEEEQYRRHKLAQRQRQLELQQQHQHQQQQQQRRAQQQQQQRRAQQQQRAQAEARAQSNATDAEGGCESDVHPLESLLRAFFGRDVAPEESTKPSQSSAQEAQPESQPEPTPAPAPATSEPVAADAEDPAEQPINDDADHEGSSAEEEDAASTLQRHYRTHLHRRQALSTLSSLADSLKTQQASFTLPEKLTFQPSPPSSATNEENDGAPASTPAPTPRLAFSPSNAPLLAYEDFLVRLLSKIDAISSGGDRTIKRARKDLVKVVNDELARIDAARDRAWAEQQKSEEVTKDFEMNEATVPVEHTEAESNAPAPTQATSDSTPTEPTATEEEATPELESGTVTATAAETVSQPTPLEAEHDAGGEQDEADGEDNDDDGHDSDSTLSVDSVEVNTAIDDIVRQARKLGERVDKLERAELLQRDGPAGSGDFVMV